MRVVGVDHIQLAMPAGREDEARRFYGVVLGIPETAKPAEFAKRGGAWFESGQVKIHLGVDPGFSARPQGPSCPPDRRPTRARESTARGGLRGV